MTDKDIIKALECCSTGGQKCSECPYTPLDWSGMEVSCDCDLHSIALDLINRQQAEIERCHKEFEELNILEEEERKEALEQARKESALFKSMVDYAIAEAIKGFAEKLKAEIISDTAYGCDSNQHSGYYDYTIKIGDIPEYIDNLVKEMVGDNK